MATGGNTVPRIEKSEHIGPDDTGDNIQAKRVGTYGFGTDNNWARIPLSLIDIAYDYISFSNPDSNNNYQTIQFYTGGSGGSIVRTLTLTYDEGNNITSIART